MMPSFNIPANETPEQRKRRVIAQALSAPSAMPQNVGEGLASIGQAFLTRQANQNAAFPTAPGRGKADWATNFRNLFTRGNNGGLY